MIHFSAHKKIEIQKITAIVTISIPEKRPDIACLIENLDNPDLSKGEKANLSIYLESLGLIKNHRLTKNGEIARKTAAVLVPESGIYNLYFVKNPVPDINSAIIHFRRIEPDKTITSSPTVPFETFAEYDDQSFSSWFSNDAFDVRFERPGSECPRVIREKSAPADVQLAASEDMVSLTIHISVHDGNKSIPLEKSEKDFSNFSLGENIASLIPGWDPVSQAVRMSFKQAQKKDILSSFRTGEKISDKTLIFRQGNDDDRWNISIESLPVLPQSELDAEEWIFELVASNLEADPGYRSSAVCRDMAQSILEKTPINDLFPQLNLSADEMKEYFKEKKPALSEYVEIADDLYPEQYIAT